ncbi:macrophage colony-stimulating factor 1 receptor 2-like [Xyrichtys novacula]|uniref:receptor protein-tyrosine kinase n=1 Tax=Xyrichtys novacula TaxID=13765 RepID=A0AAV1FPM3_XYRNO|nr:macrophage colony-stimulating factor 1 receptor 2-like [Xyrichtys novacula]
MKVCCFLLSIALSCCAADPPWIRLNSDFLPNQTELVLTAGSAFTLSCHGNGSVQWTSTAFRLLYQNPPPNPLRVQKSEPRYTGTYSCGYTNQSLEHRVTWVHLYVKDPADPSSVFVTPRRVPDVKEGQDFLFRCLLTDPSVTNLTLQSEDGQGRGRGLPSGMNVTFNPRIGALILDLQRSFNGRYVCSGWRDGLRFKSRDLDLMVVPRLRGPPALSLSPAQVKLIRLKGENFKVTCQTSNPSHFYRVTWTHPHTQAVNVTVSRRYSNSRLFINNTVTISAVSQTHTGTYTCTAVNEAGVATATTYLRVLDKPYLKIFLQPLQQVNANRDLLANVSVRSQEVNVVANETFQMSRNNGTSGATANVSFTVEVFEGQDVTLSFVMEGYPPITELRWTTPSNVVNDNNNTVYQECYKVNEYRSEGTLLLRRVRPEDGGRYSFHFCNSFFRGSRDIDLRIFRSPSALVRLENGLLVCSGFGYPLPTIIWYTCPGLQDTCGDVSSYQVPPLNVTLKEEEQVRSHLSLPVSDDDVTVECVAFNQVGESRQVFTAREARPLFSPLLIGALSTAGVFLLLLLVLFYRWRQKPRYEIRWKIIESTDGNNYTFIDPTQIPYNQKWEFPRDKLRLGPVLGSGAFGKVVEATAYGLGTDNEVTRVAVKMLKPSAHSEERDALMSELKILSHLGYHDNIVNLLGACTRGGPMLMITEYCSHGDLLNFLRAHSQDFMLSVLSVDEVVGGAFYKNMAALEARLRSDSGISCCSEYQEMKPVLSPGQTHLSVQSDSLYVSDLMRFSCQVAQGLDFLSTRNCIHRDVAARNVLLMDSGVAKICDFGLARDIRNDDSYIVQGNARLPVKWMAPESIFECVYTVQSDVWSYGVLLWEIFSLGKSPYPNVVVDTNFYKMIKDGRHMDQPDFAPAEMYQLMTLCWSLEPTDRPTFKTIGQIINRLLPQTCHSKQVTDRNMEEKEVRGGALKRGEEEEDEEEEERHLRERHDDKNEESVRKNIYQLS